MDMKAEMAQFATKQYVDQEVNTLAMVTNKVLTRLEFSITRMEAGFSELGGRFEEVDQRLDKMDERFDMVDERLKDTKDLMTYHFDGVNRRIDDINLNYAKQSQFVDHEKRICVLEKKAA